MPYSILLAKLIGLCLIITVVSLFANYKLINKALDELKNSPLVAILGGVLTLILGLILILTHNIWTLDWRILITLLGWMTLLKGVILMCLPSFTWKISKQFLSPALLNTALIILLIVGIYLTFIGFTA